MTRRAGVRDRAAIGNEGHGWPNAAKPMDGRLLTICHDCEESLRLYIVNQRFVRARTWIIGAPCARVSQLGFTEPGIKTRMVLRRRVHGCTMRRRRRKGSCWAEQYTVPDGRAEGMGALGKIWGNW